VLYPVFIQCVVDLVKGGNTDEGIAFFLFFLGCALYFRELSNQGETL
jgi:hypothetical protein